MSSFPCWLCKLSDLFAVFHNVEVEIFSCGLASSSYWRFSIAQTIANLQLLATNTPFFAYVYYCTVRNYDRHVYALER